MKLRDIASWSSRLVATVDFSGLWTTAQYRARKQAADSSVGRLLTRRVAVPIFLRKILR